MKVMFLGATHEVTGSCSLLEVNGQFGLVDYGMEQGEDIYLNKEIPVEVEKLSFVLLTHAHIDHSGLIPLLYKRGYKGLVYATKATCSLCSIMLRDSAHIQESEAEWKSRKAIRAGEEPVEPIYTVDDADLAISKLRPCNYEKLISVSEGVDVRFIDAGHLLGSASIEVFMTENDVSKKIVFSGDIGNENQPIINNPKYISSADYVVTESTYGNRIHEHPDSNNIQFLADVIQKTLDRNGNVVIPSFAVGRTQEILYFIRHIKQNNMVTGQGEFPVYIDSPLADAATGICLQCDDECFDDDMMSIIKEGINPLTFPGLRVTSTAEESKAINFDLTPKVIISASGMCEAGRIRHHLKHNLWRKECTILFVGYQAVGTTGRTIYEGAKTVKLFDEEIAVNAEIALFKGISGHADKDGLIKWINHFENKPQMIFVNHGEDYVCKEYADLLRTDYGFETYAPFSGCTYDLLNARFTETPDGVPAVKAKAKQRRNDNVFNALIKACERLTQLAYSLKEIPNKEISKLTNQINALIEKWK